MALEPEWEARFEPNVRPVQPKLDTTRGRLARFLRTLTTDDLT